VRVVWNKKQFFFSIPHYPHYLRLIKIYISTFIQEFVFYFETTLTTTDFLKSFYQHLFKNFFFISNYPHYHRIFETFYQHLFNNLFFNSPLPSLPRTSWNFFINIYSIIYFSYPHYPHYLRIFKIFISTFIHFSISNYRHCLDKKLKQFIEKIKRQFREF